MHRPPVLLLCSVSARQAKFEFDLLLSSTPGAVKNLHTQNTTPTEIKSTFFILTFLG